MKYLKYISAILFFFLLYSCYNDMPEDFDNPESTWNPGFSFPVGYTSLSMNDESGFNTFLLNDNDLSGFPDWIDEIDIPLSYTMPFNMQELDNFSEEIVRVMFRLNTYNGFPELASGQIYFQDINHNTVATMFENGPLQMLPGTVVGNGEKCKSNT